MDDRLEKAISQSNYAQTVSRQRKNMQERYETALLYSTNGGSFSATPELMSFVDLLIRRDFVDGVVVDTSNKPIFIADLPAFLEELSMTYSSASNEFYASYEKLRKGRNVKSVIGL